MSYQWTITKDHINSDHCAVGIQGGRYQVKPKPAEDFRLYDDDGNLYFEGKIEGIYSGFEPLDDYGMGAYGCTAIRYLSEGKWITI